MPPPPAYQWPSLPSAAPEGAAAGASAPASAGDGPARYVPYLRSWLTVYGAFIDDGRNSATPAPQQPPTTPPPPPEETPAVVDALATVRRLNSVLLARDAPPPCARTKATAGRSDAAASARVDNPIPLLSVRDALAAAPVGQAAAAAAAAARPPFVLLAAAAWTRRLNAAVQWLCAGVSAADGPRHSFTTQSLVQRALENVMLGVPPQTSNGTAAAACGGGGGEDPALLLDANRFGWEAIAAFQKTSTPTVDGPPHMPEALAPATHYRPALVLLLFHRHAAVRVWARERLLDCIYGAASLRLPPAEAGRSGPAGRTFQGSTEGDAADAFLPEEEATDQELRLRALWVLACQLLCTVRHLCQSRPPLFLRNSDGSLSGHGTNGTAGTTRANKELTELVGEGVYQVCVVLTVLSQSLETVSATSAAATAGGSRADAQATSSLAHKAMPLLLGGTLIFSWLSQSMDELAKVHLSHARRDTRGAAVAVPQEMSTGEGGQTFRGAQAQALQQAAADLLHGLNHQLRHDRTLQPVALAVDTKKSIVKALVHGLLDNAKVDDGDDTVCGGGGGSSAVAALRESRMRQLWAMAAVVDAPSAAHLGGAARSTCATWMLEPLFKNAGTQLDLKRALALAMRKPAIQPSQHGPREGLPVRRGGSGGLLGMQPYVRPGSGATVASLPSPAPGAAPREESGESTAPLGQAAHAYSLLLQTLLAAVPALASSPLLHQTLVQHQQDLVSLAVGAILHRASAHAVQLLSLLMRVDLLVFSAGDVADLCTGGPRSGGPTACLERVWDNYPKVMRFAIDIQPRRPPQPALGPSTTGADAPHILVQLTEALHVLVDEPRVARWLLMLPTLDSSGGPAPLVWKVRSCVEALLELLRLRTADMRRQFGESVGARPESGGGAVSRLLARRSAIPRLVHTLAYARCSSLRALGDLFKVIFLQEMAAPAHRTFATDAAEWLWRQVIMPHPLLLGATAEEREGAGENGAALPAGGPHWLKLHDAKVDNLARHWGHAWLLVLTQCNWSSEWFTSAPVYVASAWWMAALIADVVALDDPRDRHDFVEKLITQLPTPLVFATPAAPASSGPSSPPSTAASSPPPEDALQEGAYAAGRQLLLSLLEKYPMYPPTQLVAAVLYVAGALPAARAAADGPLRAAVKAQFVRMSQYLSLPAAVKATRAGEGGSANSHTTASSGAPAAPLLQYGPPWLVKAAEQATSTVDECLADQDRRLKQFEWEEEAVAREDADTRRRNAHELTRVTAAEAIRARALQRALERKREDQPVQGLVALDAQVPVAPAPAPGHDAAALKRRDREDTANGTAPPARAPQQQQQQLPSSWLSAEAHGARGKRPDPFNDPVAAVAATPSASQARRQQENDRRVRQVEYEMTEENVCARLQLVVGQTDVLQSHPDTGDIIGMQPGCMAPEVPVLPEIFVSRATKGDVAGADGPLRQLQITDFGADGIHATASSHMHVATTHITNHAAGAIYAQSFIPHIALELRHAICRDFDELVDAAASQGYLTAHPPKRPANGAGGSGEVAEDAFARLRRAFPLSRWLMEKATCAAYVPRSRPSPPQDPHRIDIDIVAHVAPSSSPRAGRGGDGAQLSATLSDNDIVLVLLPLATVLPAWFKHVQERRANGQELAAASDEPQTVEELLASVPPAWRALGCFPQVCYVSSLAYGHTPTTLTTYPVHRGRPQRRAVAPPPIPFLHALRLGFAGGPGSMGLSAALYVKRIGTLGQAFTSVRGLFSMNATKFADTLYDPRTSAARSSAYYNSLNSFLARTPDILLRLRARLVEQHAVNDGQVKAIVAALYTTVPRWDDSPALLSNTGRGDGKDGAAAMQLASGGEAPLSYYSTAPSSLASASPRFHPGPLPEILLIEGPPGTGKTQTVGTLALNLLHHLPSGARVLLCAPSNCAVDEALMRVQRLQGQLRNRLTRVGNKATAEGVKELAELLRVGVRENIGEEVIAQSPPVYLDDRVQLLRQRHGGHRTNNADSPKMAQAMKQELVTSAPIVFSTLGSLNQVQRYGGAFDVVIVDEASQATEPDVLQALMLARKRCILVGDSNQLQPTILCNAAARAGLKRSLLVRLLTNGHPSFLLKTQFRMHRDICFFPNVRYYKGQLRTDVSVDRRERPSPAEEQGQQHDAARHTIAQRLAGMSRCVFVDVPSGVMERGRGHSLKNVSEARALVAYMRQLRAFLQCTVDEFATHVGIITFYKAQRDAIMRELSHEERQSQIQIATVDSFQGKEKDIILISCVRAADATQLRQLEATAQTVAKRARDVVEARRRHRDAATGGGNEEAIVDVDAMLEDEEDSVALAGGVGFAESRDEGEEEEEERTSSDSLSSLPDVPGSDTAAVPTAPSRTPSSASRHASKRIKVETTEGGGGGEEAARQAGADALRAAEKGGVAGLGFLLDRHRINVALTRAKELCLVVGHRQTIGAVGAVEVAIRRLQQALRARAAADLPASDDDLPDVTVTAAVAGGPVAVGSPTTVDSRKDVVRAKLRHDDEDPLALAALIAHAARGGTARVDADPRGSARGRDEEEDDGDSVLIVDKEAEREAAEWAVPVHAVLCEFPRDGRLMDQLRR